MKKTKLDERIENAINAFFEPPTDQRHFAMTYTGETAIVANERTFSENADRWSGMLREIFMFGPGTLFLFCATLNSIFFYEAAGRSFSFRWYATWFGCAFLTYAGSGSIKNYRNLAVPGTVIALSLAIAFIPQLIFGKDLADQYFWHSMYLIPVVLIAAKLVQSWVSEK